MEQNKKQIAKEALLALAEIEDVTKMSELVKNNVIEFLVEGITYRIRKPNFTERQEIDTARRKKYLAFISDDSYFFRKQWYEKYLKKGINIDQMETKVKGYQQEIEEVLLRLAVAVEPRDVELLKKEIYALRDSQFNLSMEVTDLLAFCIEQQLLVYVNSYSTYLVLEKKTEEIWKKAYENYDEFMKSNDKCIEQAFMYINYLIYQHIGEGK
jgi:hypothetical protein